MKKTHTGIVAVMLTVCILGLCGCSDIRAQNLMKGITANEVDAMGNMTQANECAADFAMRLMKECNKKGENTLISPVSVFVALAMTANGAQGETLKEMEAVLGMPAEELNAYVGSFMLMLSQTEKCRLSIADSVWFTQDESFTVNRDFLQKNADYYGADIYKTAFDEQTLKDINKWVNNKTEGMIPQILGEIPQQAIMYIVNALAFKAEWASIYEEDDIKEGLFTKENGETRKAEYMYSLERCYIEGDNAEGFMKEYYGGKYAFAALLPAEGISLEEYIASLDGKALRALIENRQHAYVDAAIPKFEAEYSAELCGILEKMGMKRAVSPELADFTGIGAAGENICINQILHKTRISVGDKGTQAAASSLVGMTYGSASPAEPKPEKKVHLDRPFVYMLVDIENSVPIFIGTMTDIGA